MQPKQVKRSKIGNALLVPKPIKKKGSNVFVFHVSTVVILYFLLLCSSIVFYVTTVVILYFLLLCSSIVFYVSTVVILYFLLLCSMCLLWLYIIFNDYRFLHPMCVFYFIVLWLSVKAPYLQIINSGTLYLMFIRLSWSTNRIKLGI